MEMDTIVRYNQTVHNIKLRNLKGNTSIREVLDQIVPQVQRKTGFPRGPITQLVLKDQYFLNESDTVPMLVSLANKLGFLEGPVEISMRSHVGHRKASGRCVMVALDGYPERERIVAFSPTIVGRINQQQWKRLLIEAFPELYSDMPSIDDYDVLVRGLLVPPELTLIQLIATLSGGQVAVLRPKNGKPLHPTIQRALKSHLKSHCGQRGTAPPGTNGCDYHAILGAYLKLKNGLFQRLEQNLAVLNQKFKETTGVDPPPAARKRPLNLAPHVAMELEEDVSSDMEEDDEDTETGDESYSSPEGSPEPGDETFRAQRSSPPPGTHNPLYPNSRQPPGGNILASFGDHQRSRTPEVKYSPEQKFAPPGNFSPQGRPLVQPQRKLSSFTPPGFTPPGATPPSFPIPDVPYSAQSPPRNYQPHLYHNAPVYTPPHGYAPTTGYSPVANYANEVAGGYQNGANYAPSPDYSGRRASNQAAVVPVQKSSPPDNVTSITVDYGVPTDGQLAEFLESYESPDYDALSYSFYDPQGAPQMSATRAPSGNRTRNAQNRTPVFPLRLDEAAITDQWDAQALQDMAEDLSEEQMMDMFQIE
nr:hypothetical protein [Salmonid herpesvirus 1]